MLQSVRLRHGLAAAAVAALALWGPTASAAPSSHPAKSHPIMITHVMSSCGSMDEHF
jgi:hypothetical protein